MFIDTNVIVRTRMGDAPDHHIAVASLERAMNSGEDVFISRQVIREFLAVVTRPQSWSPAMSMTEALDNVQWMLNRFQILEDGPEVTDMLRDLCLRFMVGGRQIHDANIVATMLVHEERRLMTFNPRDFRRYGNMIELVETYYA